MAKGHFSIDASKVSIMPDLCVVYGCNNVSDLLNGVGLHKIPYYGKTNPEEVRRRKKWVDFVLWRRANWTPSECSAVCSKHFKREDFNCYFAVLPGQTTPSNPRLLRDKLGVCVYLTIQSNDPEYYETVGLNQKKKVR